MDAIFVPIADAVGASVSQLKLITCLLVAYPLGSIFIRIPSHSPALRHLFNISIALFFFIPVLHITSAFVQLLVESLIVYFIAKHHTGPSMPWIVFLYTMGHLMVNHIIRLIGGISYETIEVTGPQMVLTMKLSTFAWNVWDGRRAPQDLDKWQTKYAVKKYPSILEFIGYAFYFPGVLVGPYLEYNDYADVISEKLFDGYEVKGNTRKIPTGRKRVAYMKMLKGLLFLGIFVLFGSQYNFSVVLTPWFAEQKLWSRILLLQFYGCFERTKYVAIWTLTEGASILTGHGFTGFSPDGKSLWTGAANIKVRCIELPSSFKMLVDNWNMKANVWLRECVYKRVTPKGSKAGFMSSMLTFLASAVWHGVSAGYYLAFLYGGLITTAARLGRSGFRPLFLESPLLKKSYDVITCIMAIMCTNYLATPFMLLTLKDSLKAWKLLGWYGHIFVVGGMVFFYAGGLQVLRSFQKKTGAPVSKTSGTATPVGEKTFTFPPRLDELVPPHEK